MELTAVDPGYSQPDWAGITGPLDAIVQDLEHEGLLHAFHSSGGVRQLRAMYRGLVWETRRGYTVDAALLDRLRKVGEAVNVDFKRELVLKDNDQKAEFVKDVIGLANPPIDGGRWLIIGFEDKTLDYYQAPDPSITPDRLEDIVNRYTDPPITVRYEVVDYRGQRVGKLEVLSDRTQVPYRVAKAIHGANKRIEAGDIYARHGTHTELALESELQALEEERQRARSRA